MKKFDLTPEEAQQVKTMTETFLQTEDPSKSIKENMIGFYAAQFDNIAQEEIETTVDKLIQGTRTLTETYAQALQNEGFDYAEALNEKCEELSLKEKYELYLNFLAALRTIDYDNATGTENVNASFEEIKGKLLTVHEVVTPEMCDKLLEEIGESLNNSTFFATGNQTIRQLLDAATEGQTAVSDYLNANYDDMKLKQYTALATYIAFQKGEIPSIPADTLPEIVALGIAAGIEQEKIIEDVKSGNKTFETAALCLKILGGVALFCALGLLMLYVLAVAQGAIISSVLALFGTSTIAMIAAGTIGILVAVGVCPYMVEAGGYVMSKAGEIYDRIIAFVEETAYPWAAEKIRRFVAFIKQKLSRREIATTEPVQVARTAAF